MNLLEAELKLHRFIGKEKAELDPTALVQIIEIIQTIEFFHWQMLKSSVLLLHQSLAFPSTTSATDTYKRLTAEPLVDFKLVSILLCIPLKPPGTTS